MAPKLSTLSPSAAVLIQARLGSSRLPGKCLLPLPMQAETTVLGHVVSRARQAQGVAQVIVATSDTAADDPLAAAAEQLGAAVFRGDEQDVLGRLYAASQVFGPAVVVRLTADNPAIDPQFITAALAHHHATCADYTLTTGLPLGTNLEVMNVSALARAHAEARQPAEREHVTPYLRRYPELFRLETLALAVPPAVAALRLTLDYPSDYALLHLLFSQLPADFSLTHPAGLPALLARYPWLAAINAANEQLRPAP